VVVRYDDSALLMAPAGLRQWVRPVVVGLNVAIARA